VDEAVPRPDERPSGGLEVAAHLIAALLIGSVAPFLVVWTAPGYAFGVVPGGFELVEIAPQLVAALSLGLALLVRALGFGWLRDVGWIVAAVGLAGLAGLYAQGTSLDGLTLTILLVVVISLQVVGLLVAFARAGGLARWAVAVGLAAGIAGGREALALVVTAVRQGPLKGSLHGDDLVLGGVAVLVAVAGVVLLVIARGERAYPAPAESWPSAWWSVVLWPLVAVVVSSVIAVMLTRVWNARLDRIVRDYFIGGISESDAVHVQTTDQLARVGTAVVIAAILVIAAQLRGGPGVVRWVLAAFGVGLVLTWLQEFLAAEPSWLTAGLALVGTVVGVVAVHYLDRAMPWEVVGLLLATGLILDGPSALRLLGAFGLGLAIAGGLLRLASGSGRAPRLGPGGVTVAAALGLAAWVLGHQVVVPSASFYRADLGGLPVLPIAVAVGVSAVAGVVFFLVDRARTRPAH
jgi:hypothetical protein